DSLVEVGVSDIDASPVRAIPGPGLFTACAPTLCRTDEEKLFARRIVGEGENVENPGGAINPPGALHHRPVRSIVRPGEVDVRPRADAVSKEPIAASVVRKTCAVAIGLGEW